MRCCLSARAGERNGAGAPVDPPRARRPRAAGTAGERVARYLQTPFDVLAFGPRAGFGALTSLPEQLAGLWVSGGCMEARNRGRHGLLP